MSRYLKGIGLGLLFLIGLNMGPVLAQEEIIQSDLQENELALTKDTQVTIEISEKNDTQFIIKTNGCNEQENIKAVSFPVWTEQNGQDDIRWYQGIRQNNGEFSLSVDIKDHSFQTGLYQVHAYFYDDDSQIIGIKTETFLKKTTDIVIDPQEVINDQYIIKIHGLSNEKGVTSVLVPTWSQNLGQDDIRWEEARYIGDNCWEVVIDLKKYKKSYDCYYSHIYVRDDYGNQKFFGMTQQEIKNPFKNDPVRIEFLKDVENGKFRIATNNCQDKCGIEAVRFAVWTERNGQDDIKWYTAKQSDSEYSTEVDIETHGFESGNYIVHTYVYGRENEVVSVGPDSFIMEKGNPAMEFDNAVLDNTYKVRIGNVSSESGVKGVYLPTWSQSGGQDDLKWEPAVYIGNKTWEAKINLNDYSHIVDNFVSHAYVLNQDGEMEYQQQGVKKINQDTRTIYGYFGYPLSKSYHPNASDPTDWFGPRWGDIHEGIDIPAPYYAKCYSVCEGTVERAGYFMGYGRYVRIRTVDRYGESVSFFYGHLQEINVSVGQTVSEGQLIGSVGGSGYNNDIDKIYIDNAYGPHLHFGAIANADDACVDPEIWIDFHNPANNK